jgi:integrase
LVVEGDDLWPVGLQELGAFLDHVRDDRLYALWLLVATTGMRRGELAGLRWVDIDFDHATVSPTIPPRSRRPPGVLVQRAVGCWPMSQARPTAPWHRAARSASPTPATHPQTYRGLAGSAPAGGSRGRQGEGVMAMAAAGHRAG